jgi:hypothetical protein
MGSIQNFLQIPFYFLRTTPTDSQNLAHHPATNNDNPIPFRKMIANTFTT